MVHPRPRILLPVAALGAASAATAYGALYERTAFTLRRPEVPLLPAGADPLRVLHLSDIHLLPGQARKQRWIADLARLLPDLVVLTGDSLAAPAVAELLDCLAPLLRRPGVFVLGSNDYYAPRPKNPLRYLNPGHRRVIGAELPWRDLVAGLTGAGWLDLTNRRATLRAGGYLIDVRGVDDPHLKRDRLDAVSGPPVPGADLAVGVVHAPEPRVLTAFSGDGAQLLFSGHTHGGQLRVPGYGALVTNCGLDRARARGLSRWPDADGGPGWLHVSAGLGTSPYAPVRFACRPEASLLSVVGVSAADSHLAALGADAAR